MIPTMVGGEIDTDDTTRCTDLLKSLNRDEFPKSKVVLYENVMAPETADTLLQELFTRLPWKVETDNFGPQSRPTCYFGDSPDCVFCYVGLTLVPLPWTPTLLKLRMLVASACLVPSNRLSACLINQYPANEGCIPWHYDEIRAHGQTKTVASLSLGGPRRFQLRSRSSSELVEDRLLPSGSVLLMQGDVQEQFEHCLPLDENQSPPRISLTFRSIVPGWEHKGKTAASTDACCTQAPTTYVNS